MLKKNKVKKENACENDRLKGPTDDEIDPKDVFRNFGGGERLKREKEKIGLRFINICKTPPQSFCMKKLEEVLRHQFFEWMRFVFS